MKDTGEHLEKLRSVSRTPDDRFDHTVFYGGWGICHELRRRIHSSVVKTKATCIDEGLSDVCFESTRECTSGIDQVLVQICGGYVEESDVDH